MITLQRKRLGTIALILRGVIDASCASIVPAGVISHSEWA
jgi:hypothetical protein